MKTSIFFLLFLVSVTGFSQNIIREAIKASNLKEIAYNLGLEPGSKQTIPTKFVVEKVGTLTQIEATSAYPALNEEAVQILKGVGKLVPREVRGEYVIQQISLPMVFYVETQEQRKLRLRKEARRKG